MAKILKTKNDHPLAREGHDKRLQELISGGWTEVRTYEVESKRDGIINRKTKWIISEVTTPQG